MPFTPDIQTCYSVQPQNPKQQFRLSPKIQTCCNDLRQESLRHTLAMQWNQKVVKPLRNQKPKATALQDPLAMQQNKSIAGPLRNTAKPLRHLFAMLQNNCGHPWQWKKSEFLRCLTHLAQTIARLLAMLQNHCKTVSQCCKTIARTFRNATCMHACTPNRNQKNTCKHKYKYRYRHTYANKDATRNRIKIEI